MARSRMESITENRRSISSSRRKVTAFRLRFALVRFSDWSGSSEIRGVDGFAAGTDGRSSSHGSLNIVLLVIGRFRQDWTKYYSFVDSRIRWTRMAEVWRQYA